MTTIAVLQCGEKGKLSLDTDVTSILHEYKEAKILTGFDESGEPILKEKGGPITVQLVNYHLRVCTSLTQSKDNCSHILRDCHTVFSIPSSNDGVTRKGKRLLVE